MTDCRQLFFSMIATVSLGVGLGCESGSDEPSVPPELYRSKVSAIHVEFAGVQAELRAAMLHEDLLVRAARLGTLLQTLGPESAEQVLEVYESVWTGIGSTELVLLADWWARFDPHAALKWAHSDVRTARTRVPFVVLRAWARSDPGAAINEAFKGRNNDPDIRNGYIGAVIEGWEVHDPSSALDFIYQLGPGEARQKAIRGMALRKVLRLGINDAFRWGDAISDEEENGENLFKLNVLRRIATYSAQVDPVATSKWADQYAGTYYMRSLPQRITIHWTKTDPRAAMAWLKSLANGRDQDEGMREGFRSWARRDFDAAIAWLLEGEHERYKDEGLALYAKRLQLGDPVRAIELASQIVDPVLRVATQAIVARSWAVQDEKAATKWVEEESGMTDQEKHRALTFGDRWREGTLKALKRRAELEADSAAQKLEEGAAPAAGERETVDGPDDSNQS